MTTDPSRGASTRSTPRARERTEPIMPLDAGIDRGAAAPVGEESPYERFVTGGDTVMAKPRPLRVDTPRVILAGTVIWALALAVTLLVPTLHSGTRHWWPWTCVAGVVLGLLGFAYVRRGRGNAEAA